MHGATISGARICPGQIQPETCRNARIAITPPKSTPHSAPPPAPQPSTPTGKPDYLSVGENDAGKGLAVELQWCNFGLDANSRRKPRSWQCSILAIRSIWLRRGGGNLRSGRRATVRARIKLFPELFRPARLFEQIPSTGQTTIHHLPESHQHLGQRARIDRVDRTGRNLCQVNTGQTKNIEERYSFGYLRLEELANSVPNAKSSFLRPNLGSDCSTWLFTRHAMIRSVLQFGCVEASFGARIRPPTPSF